MRYRDAGFYEQNGCRVLYGRSAVRLDAAAKTVELDDGTILPYDSICVAAGSSPFLPPLEGLETVEKAFTFMTLDDALALEAAVKDDSRVLIVGAGLIGSNAPRDFITAPPPSPSAIWPAGCCPACWTTNAPRGCSGIWRRTASASCLATVCAVWTAKRRI